MSAALVSVVIPTYNRAYCIERAIDSVLTQTHHDVDVIVVDDGSTDDTRGLITRQYGDDARVRYFHQENRGVTGARNAGLRQVRGEYVALLDSDDVWKPWKLELQVACLERLPQAGMIWTDMEAIDSDGHMFDPAFLRTMYSAYQWFDVDDLFNESHPLPMVSVPLPIAEAQPRLYVGDIFSPMVMGNLVHTSTVLLRRERFEKVGGFNEELHYSGEDYDFHLRTCREGPVAFVSLASIEYQKGMPDQLTGDAYNIFRARNFLKTITPVLERDRDRIRLPRHMICFLLSDAHQWIGEAALDIGENAEARGHLSRSLFLRPWQPRTAGLLIVALLPRFVGNGMRRLYRAAKALLFRPAVETPPL